MKGSERSYLIWSNFSSLKENQIFEVNFLRPGASRWLIEMTVKTLNFRGLPSSAHRWFKLYCNNLNGIINVRKTPSWEKTDLLTQLEIKCSASDDQLRMHKSSFCINHFDFLRQKVCSTSENNTHRLDSCIKTAAHWAHFSVYQVVSGWLERCWSCSR
jgi:hypothetical protein